MRNCRLAFLFLLISPAAFALNNRSAVSVNGLDTNPCTPASPCRSFGAAMAQTNSGGEIIALDSAGYGPFTIGQSVTVSGAPGVHAAITVSSGDGISISTGSPAIVIIRNLVLIGAGGAVGIHQLGAPQLRVIGCLIRGFDPAGIQSDPSAGAITIHRTSVLDNPGTGILINGQNLATITDCTIEGSQTGVEANDDSKVVVAHSTIAGNYTGAFADSENGGLSVPALLVLEACTIAHNTIAVAAGANLNNNTAVVYLSQNVIAFSFLGMYAYGAGTAYSFVNNRFEGNDTDGGPFTTIAFK